MTEVIRDIPKQKIHVVGGGTISPVREHLALSARAYGTAARQIADIAGHYWTNHEDDIQLHLTRMADPQSRVETVDELADLAHGIVRDPESKVVFWSPAVADFSGRIGDVESGLHAERLSSAEGLDMRLEPTDKIVPIFRSVGIDGNPPRKDLFAVGFKTTTGKEPEQQYSAGLDLLKKNSLNLVLANDTVTRNNMVITPEEAPYHETTDREIVLHGLVEMAHLRSQMHYTRTEVVPGESVEWSSEQIPDSLRAVVEHCIARGAYKPFRGSTTGHFSVKLGPGHILSSRRKTDFNDIEHVGMVDVQYSDGHLTARGSKPSAGARAQIAVYDAHPEMDCIVHFHSPLKPGAVVNTVEQRPYECGSYECGTNTANGLVMYEGDDVAAVMLDKHGPNIVFKSTADPRQVIDFIERNFDLAAKTGEYIPVG